MGYWSKGVFYQGGAHGRKQLGELRKIVDEMTDRVKAKEITAKAAVIMLLEEHELLSRDTKNHPMITSGLMELYTREFVPKLRANWLPKLLPPALAEELEGN